MARFDVVVREIAEGGTADGAAVALASALGSDEARARMLLATLPAVVAPDIDEHQAEPIFHTLREAGLIVELRRVQSSRHPSRPPSLAPGAPLVRARSSTPPAMPRSSPPHAFDGQQPPLETAPHLGLPPLELDPSRSALPLRSSPSWPPLSRPIEGARRPLQRPARGFWQYLPSFLVVPLRGSGLAWIGTTGVLMVAGSVVCGLLGLGLMRVAGPAGFLVTYVLASVLCASLYFAYFRAGVMAAFEDDDRLGPVTLASNSVSLGTAAVAWNGLLFGLATLASFGPLLARGVEAVEPADFGRALLHTWPIWYAATMYAYFANGLMALRQDWRAFVAVIPLVRLAMHAPLQVVATVIAIHVGSLVATVPYLVCVGVAFALHAGFVGLSLVAGIGLFSGIYAIGTAAVAMGNLFRANAADVGEMNPAHRH